MAKEKLITLCSRQTPTLAPKEDRTFPMYKVVSDLDENGDPHERYVEMTEEEKLNLRANSPYVDIGECKATSPLPRDKFEVLDQLDDFVDNISDEEVEELRNLKD